MCNYSKHAVQQHGRKFKVQLTDPTETTNEKDINDGDV